MDSIIRIYNQLYNIFGNKYGVCALMGNLKAESALRSNNAQNSGMIRLGMTDETYTAGVDNGTYKNFVKDSIGYGLAQWTYWSRKQALLNYAKQCNKSIGDEAMQISFLGIEIAGYKNVFNAIVTAKDVKSASDVILTQYEKPKNQSEANKKARAKLGEEILKYVENYNKGVITDGTSNNITYIICPCCKQKIKMTLSK